MAKTILSPNLEDYLETVYLIKEESNIVMTKEVAKKMKISQPTFHRLILSARRKIADAIVNGKAIKIEGGNFKIIGKRKFRQGNKKL